jgi:hypothetical protein
MLTMHVLKSIIAVCCLCFFIALFPSNALCQENKKPGLAVGYSMQLVTGLLYSPVIHTKRETLDYALVDLRFGWLLDPAKTSRRLGLNGAFEMLVGLNYASVFEGPGGYFSGVTGFLRYDFMPPKGRFVPYFQMGAGIVYNDIYKNKKQWLIGQSIEFTPQASIGLHSFLDHNWALDLEFMFHHISNAGLADRNYGVNSLGGFVGVTYCF